jgi:hypothetical protein
MLLMSGSLLTEKDPLSGDSRLMAQLVRSFPLLRLEPGNEVEAGIGF